MKKSTIISVVLTTSLILGSAFAESTNKAWKETKVYTVVGSRHSEKDHTSIEPSTESKIEVEVWSRGRKGSSKIPSASKVKHVVLTGGETAPENGN